MLAQWLNNNCLYINISKTKALLFNHRRSDPDFNICLNGFNVDIVDEMNCLGVVIDNKLEFSSHIEKMRLRVMFQLRRLYSLNAYLPIYIRQRVATSLLMSHINYCLEVISGTTACNLAKVERILNSIVRYVYGLRRFDHISVYVIRFLGMPFKTYVNLRVLQCFYKLITFNSPPLLCSRFAFCRSSRNPQLLIPRFVSVIFERSFVVRVSRLWNHLPLSLRNFSFSNYVFKCRCIDHFLSTS